MSECKHGACTGTTRADGSVALHWSEGARDVVIARSLLEELVEEANHFKRLRRSLARVTTSLHIVTLRPESNDVRSTESVSVEQDGARPETKDQESRPILFGLPTEQEIQAFKARIREWEEGINSAHPTLRVVSDIPAEDLAKIIRIGLDTRRGGDAS